MGQEYEIVKGFKTNQGLGRYDYDYLHNKPDLATQEQAGLLSPEDKARIDQIDKIKQAVDEIDYPVDSVNGKTGQVKLTKEDIGLNKVENKTSKEICNEITKENVTGALGYTPLTEDEINEAVQGANNAAQAAQTTADKALQGVATALPISGGSMAGSIDMNNNSLTGLAQPQKDNDAATKTYVDKLVKNIDLSNYPTKEEVNNQFEEFQVDVDPTLSESGQAADAKAVGDAIADMVYSGEAAGEAATVPLNADTLGGRPASEFATENFVIAKIAEAQMEGGDVDLSGYATKDELNALTAEDVGARPDTWFPSISDIGAAPAGYVESSYRCNTIDSVKGAILAEFAKIASNKIGFFHMYVDAVPTNVLSPGDYTVMIGKEGDQYANVCLRSGVSVFYTDIKASVVGDFCWLNPPMYPGEEFRTTERWNGKPVYTMMANIGALPNNAGKTTEDGPLPMGITPISAYGIGLNGKTGAVIPSRHIYLSVYGEWGTVYVNTDSDYSNYTGYIIVKYVKD